MKTYFQKSYFSCTLKKAGVLRRGQTILETVIHYSKFYLCETEQWFCVECWHLLNRSGWQGIFRVFFIQFHLDYHPDDEPLSSKLYWLFLITGFQISETGNFKINKTLAPSIHTLHCITLFFLLASHFPQFSIALSFTSFLFIIQTCALHESAKILWIMKT